MSKTDWEVRKRRLAELGFSSYAEYLKSDHWGVVRSEFGGGKQGATCSICQMDENGPWPRLTMDIHHLNYERLGRETRFDITTVCRRCHENVHALEKQHDETVHAATARAWWEGFGHVYESKAKVSPMKMPTVPAVSELTIPLTKREPGDAFNNGHRWTCLKCGEQEIHLFDINTWDGAGFRDTMSTVLSFYCENNHTFAVKIEFHKGEMVASTCIGEDIKGCEPYHCDSTNLNPVCVQ